MRRGDSRQRATCLEQGGVGRGAWECREGGWQGRSQVTGHRSRGLVGQTQGLWVLSSASALTLSHMVNKSYVSTRFLLEEGSASKQGSPPGSVQPAG